MKKTILINLIVLLVISGLAPAETRLVPDDYATIQDAIDACVDGDKVILAPGTYTGEGNLDIDFLGKAITVQSTDPNDPNIVAATIIDCNGSEDNRHRGFYFQTDEEADSILAGLTITNGYANYYGGGIRCEGSSPSITNCIIRDNIAQYYYIPPPPPVPSQTPVSNIRSVNDNMGIYINCPYPPLDWGGQGGGVYCYDSNPTLTNCKFINNFAHQYGGGMYNYLSSPMLINCLFLGNSSDSGGGIENQDNSNITLTGCVFTANTALYGGGGMRNADNSNPTLTDCTFIDNSAGWSGGMGNYNSNPTITNCTFRGNHAETDGGGMNNGTLCSPVLTNCIFTKNSANKGGGMYNSSSSPTMSKCEFNGNSAEYGGGIYNSDSYLTLLSCVLSGNYCYEHGGGIYNPVSDLKLVNCTLTGNSAGTQGGGIYMFPPPPPPPIPDGARAADSYSDRYIINNCILWENLPEQIVNYGLGLSVTYSNVQGGWDGEGNINVDPCFVQPGYWGPAQPPPPPPCCPPLTASYLSSVRDYYWIEGDYHLLPDSPCIDAGDPNYLAEPNETDLEGNPRIINGLIDMGAYEYNPPIPAELMVLPRTINRSSQGQKVLAVICFSQLFSDDDIGLYEPLILYPWEIEATNQFLMPNGDPARSEVRIIAVFDKADIIAATPVYGDVEVTVVGKFTSGEYFYGTDTVRIISGREGYRYIVRE